MFARAAFIDFYLNIFRSAISSQSKKKDYLVQSKADSVENIAKLSAKVNKKNCKGMAAFENYGMMS